SDLQPRVVLDDENGAGVRILAVQRVLRTLQQRHRLTLLHGRGILHPHRIRAPSALAASSTASFPVSFSRSRIGFTSTSSSESRSDDSAISSSARWASR